MVIVFAAMVLVNTAPGALDSAFAPLFVEFGPGSVDRINASVIDPQGRIVVAGFSNVNGTDDFALARYMPDGHLDGTFGNGGLVLTNFGGDDVATAVALDVQGRIVVAGITEARGELDFVTARYTPNGQLDPAFANGHTLTDFGSDLEYAKAIVIDSEGRIIVVGDTFDGDWDLALVRLMSDGEQDPTFSGGTVHTGLGDSENAHAVALDASGRIVVAGHGEASSILIVRYNVDGTLDPTFGQNGAVKAQKQFGEVSAAYALAIDDLGRIVVAGTRTRELGPELTNYDFIVARYHDNGAPDNLFGSGGWVSTGFGGNDFARGLAIDAEGRLVVAGSNLGPGGDFKLARYTPYGALDETFGQAGRIGTDLGGDEEIKALALDAEGRIVVAGASTASGTWDFVVRRYQTRSLADLRITKVASAPTVVAGDVVRYDVGIFNDGPDAATAVSVVDTLPSSMTFRSCISGGLVCDGTGNTRTITYPGLSKTIPRSMEIAASVNFDVPDGTVITNTATVSAASPDDPNTSNNSASATITVRNKSDLLVTESVAKLPNRQLSYTITVQNLGPFGARQIVLNDPLPNGTNFISATSATLSCTLLPNGTVGTLSCTRAALDLGQTASVTLVVKVTAAGSVDIVNTATASSGTFDPNPANNAATLTTRVSGK